MFGRNTGKKEKVYIEKEIVIERPVLKHIYVDRYGGTHSEPDPPEDPPEDRKLDRIFISPAGDCFHTSEQCQGLRGRTIIAKRTCRFCSKKIQ